MLKNENSKKLILSLVIFFLPFLEFLKNNINEIDIIIGISFYILIAFLILVLLVQILHDFLFYFLVIKPYPKFKNTVIDEFKEYAKHYQSQAVLADSMIYLFTTPLLYFIISKQSQNINIFISLVCIYLMGYFIHQKN